MEAKEIKVIKCILKVINSIIITLSVVILLLVITIKVSGIQLYTVLSGSMEPNYPTGSLIAVKEIEVEELKEGDVITYKLSGTTIATHRIVEVLDEDNSLKFRTKGDANEDADASPVIAENVIGTPFVTIPKGGYIASYAQSPEGKKKIITVFAVLMAYVFLTDFTILDKKKNKPDEILSKGVKEDEENN